MKRLIALLLLACLLPGAFAGAEGEIRGYDRERGYVYLTLGQYMQTAEGEMRPILWRVLAADEEKAYLLSEYILFARAMHPSLKEYRDVLKGDFAQTELCQYLNTTFAEEAFTEEEMSMLLPCKNFGKVFLITRKDIQNKEIGLGVWSKPGVDPTPKQIKDNPMSRAYGTEWAIKNNGYDPEEYPDPSVHVMNAAGTDEVTLQEKRLYVFKTQWGSFSPQWVRDQSTKDKRHAGATKDGGQIGHIEVGRDNIGARPALYLAMGSYQIVSGTGTMEDPFEIVPADAAE
jgi:hypothetical protein